MKRISVRLWVQMLFLIGVTLGALWFFQVVMLEKYYLYSQTKSIKAQGADLAADFAAGAQEEVLQRQAEELNLKYNAGVEIYNISGERVFGNITGPMMMGRVMDKREVFTGASSGETIVRQVKHSRLNSSFLLVGIPVKQGLQVSGVLIISSPLASIKEAESIIKEQLLLVTAIMLLISLVLTYYSSKAFTRPILKINEAAAKMARGNLSVRLEVKSNDELGMLSDTINDLSVQLQKIEQLRKELIANVSHEFRTPLSLIKGYAETVRDVTGDNPEKRNRQLDIILEEADRLKNMVNDTLNLSQMESEYFQLDVKTFDIAASARNIRNRFSYMLEQKGQQLELSESSEAIFVSGDELRIEQVLYNFVNNACSHTAAGGFIRIEILENADNVKIKVTDNGKGIDSEEIPYIWDRFYKASAEGKGTGLGLAIAKKILEAHGSSFGVESEPGRGSTFWFTLSRAQ